MADNYLEKKYDEYLERKAAAEKARRLAWKKRMDAYRKKLAEEAEKAGKDNVTDETEESKVMAGFPMAHQANATEVYPKAEKEDKTAE